MIIRIAEFNRNCFKRRRLICRRRADYAACKLLEVDSLIISLAKEGRNELEVVQLSHNIYTSSSTPLQSSRTYSSARSAHLPFFRPCRTGRSIGPVVRFFLEDLNIIFVKPAKEWFQSHRIISMDSTIRLTDLIAQSSVRESFAPQIQGSWPRVISIATYCAANTNFIRVPG